MCLNKIIAFVKKDFLISKSYRLLFVLNIPGLFFPVFIFYFISKLFNADSPYLQIYGGKYFPFVFIGLAINGYLWIVFYACSLKMRNEQLMGTLEAIFSTPINYFTLILGFISWDFLMGIMTVLIYMLIGVFLLSLHLSLIGFLSATIVIILGMISLGSLGIIFASFILYFKKGELIAWSGIILSGFLSGVYFPIKVFPPILQKIAHFIPLTYILRALRLSLLSNQSLHLLRNDVIILSLFCIILFPVSLAIFRLSIKKTMTEGFQVY